MANINDLMLLSKDRGKERLAQLKKTFPGLVYHSRLLIARQFLREDGVIFISINDNEAHHQTSRWQNGLPMQTKQTKKILLR